MFKKTVLGLFCAALGVAGTLIGATPASAKQFDGVTVNLMTFTGPVISSPLQARAPDFDKLTGAHVNIITVPFADLYTKILTDFATGTNSIDAIVFPPQWMVDFANPGYLLPLDKFIAKDKKIDWNGITPFIRDFSTRYAGKIYSVPLDGDMLTIYYRKDLLKRDGLKPPETWDQYVSIAKHFQGKDLNGDGKPDYGSCVTMKRNAQAYWMIYAIASPYLQYKGTRQGVFFNLKNMDPLVKNPGMRRAMEIYKDLVKYGPPGQLNFDISDSRNMFLSGRCALILDWGDTGTLVIDPKQSHVIGKVGVAMTPGSTQVYDRSTRKMEKCTPKLCPYAVDGVNHAPYAAFGGWSGAVNAASKPRVQEAAYAFLSYMSQPAQSNVDVTIGTTGMNPYRTVQYKDLDKWVKAGMTKAFAKSYLGAIKKSFESPNVVLDLRIPYNQRYQEVVLDSVVAQMAAGQLSIDQAMNQLYKGWQQITKQIGRKSQLAAYKKSLEITSTQ